MNRLWILFIALGVLALAAFILAFPYFFPPLSIQECNKLGGYLSSTSWSYQNYRQVNCVKYVAAIRRDEGFCRYIPEAYDRNSCEDIVTRSLTDFRATGYGSIQDLREAYCYGYGYDENMCKAITLAQQGK